MGVFRKIKQLSGGASPELLEHGRLGRGVVVDVEPNLTVEVRLDDEPPYLARCHQHLPDEMLDRLVPGQTTVAVRVNANDYEDVAIDFSTPPPP